MSGSMTGDGTIRARDRELLVITDDREVAIEHFRACHHTLCTTLGPGPHYPELGLSPPPSAGVKHDSP